MTSTDTLLISVSFVTQFSSLSLCLSLQCLLLSFPLSIHAKVSNSGGTIESSATLDIHAKVQESTEEDYPPGFTSTLEDHSVTEGSAVQYNCRIKGQPFPEVVWFLDGTELKHGKEFKVTMKEDNLLLVILCTSLNQSGTIVCQVQPPDNTACTPAFHV